ncbi:MarR family transcriptional regulator [Streptomyces sp. NPDC047097]|uniref:MarR family winged helix-turn-helix transcriptional regulator n=1 Tax=Streptomyces sp. NPDC047097 TaxID=3155260 RepID=UPI0033E04D86
MAQALRGRTGGESELWRQLLLLVHRVGHTLDRKLQRRHGVSAAEHTTLAALAGGALRMQELAEAAGTSQSTMSRMVGRLVEAGLATRTVGEEDRRVMVAALTDEGRALLQDVQKTFAAELERALDLAAFEPATASLVNRLRHDPSARAD